MWSWPRHPTRPRSRLKNGDTIRLKNSSAYPSTEQTLASLALILRGGGIPNLESLQNEIYNVVNGRAEQIHAFLGKLDTFTARLDEQRGDITRAIDSTNRLLAYVASRSDVLERVLTEFPPLIKHFADKQNLLINAVDAIGRLSRLPTNTCPPRGATFIRTCWRCSARCGNSAVPHSI